MTTEAAILDAPADPLAHPFIRSLVSLIRAGDRFGSWEKKPDADLLKDFIVDKEAKKGRR